MKHRGFRSTLEYYKDVRLCVTRYLSGNPIDPKQISQTIGLYPDGIPKKVGKVRNHIISGDPSSLRIILTILNYGRMFVLPVLDDPSVASITRTNSGYWSRVEEFRGFVKNWKRKVFPNEDFPIVDPSPQYMGHGSGANGRPSIFLSLWEAVHMPESFIELIEDLNFEIAEKLRQTKEHVQEMFPAGIIKNDLFPWYHKLKWSKNKKGVMEPTRVRKDAEDDSFA